MLIIRPHTEIRRRSNEAEYVMGLTTNSDMSHRRFWLAGL